jgi:hypothetical protein
MFILPIQLSDPEFSYIDRRFLNARFGIYLAITMLYSIKFDDITILPKEMATNEELSKIIANHALWLSRLNTKNLLSSPTFINANFWEAYLFASTGTL